MKPSLYNSLIRINGRYHLLYNAMKDDFLILNSKLHADWSDTPIEKLPQTNPSFYEQLAESGCIVEESADESGTLKEQITAFDKDPSTFRLTVNPTLNCNFRCWYCYEEHQAKSVMSEEIRLRLVRYVEDMLKNNEKLKNFSLSFFGGEPLLKYEEVVNPLITEVAALCRQYDKRLSLSFTSNSYLLDRKKISFLAGFRPVSFQVTLDGPREMHDRVRFAGNKGSYDRILKNVRLLLEHKIMVTLRINFTNDNLGYLGEIANDLEKLTPEMKKYLGINFQQVWQDRDSEKDPYDEIVRQRQIFTAKGIVNTFKSIRRLGSSCYADKEMGAIVNYNGDVFRCTARDFIPARREGYLDKGTIVWEKQSGLRQAVKFRNRPCSACRIAPLCYGGCSQQALEHAGKDYCLYDYDEQKKDNLVLARFMNLFMNPQNP